MAKTDEQILNRSEYDVDIDVPSHFYNIRPDLPTPLAPMLNSQTDEPIGPKDIEPLFPRELIRLEFSDDRFISIPHELRAFYRAFGRVTPLKRLYSLEEHLDTPAHIYLKREDVSPTGSHKINTAIAQALYAAKEGINLLTTETGAGQWGSALSLSTCLIAKTLGFDISTEVFMVRCSYNQKPFRKTLMQLYDATIHASPSSVTNTGKHFSDAQPDHPGSLGIAISEAVERAVTNPSAKYSLGSVLNAVLIHQSVIGLEAEQQLIARDETPDYVVGCVGGGSNFAGLAFPLRKRFPDAKIIAAESTACPALTKGDFRYDFADTGKLGPLIKGHTMGYDYIPPPIHAGGLRYHSTAPAVSNLIAAGEVHSVSYPQTDAYSAGKMVLQTEGLLPAPETTHALKAAINIAREAKKNQQQSTIVVGYSGHGLLDLTGYQEFLNNNLIDL